MLLVGSDCVHFGERNGSTIWVSHNHESPPCGVLDRPKNRNSDPSRLFLPCVGVLHVEAHGCCPSCSSRRKDAPLIVTSVIPMQNDPSRRPTDNDDDVIFETDRKAKGADVKRPRFTEAFDKQNQAVEVVNFHVSKVSEGGRTSCPLPMTVRRHSWTRSPRRLRRADPVQFPRRRASASPMARISLGVFQTARAPTPMPRVAATRPTRSTA